MNPVLSRSPCWYAVLRFNRLLVWCFFFSGNRSRSRFKCQRSSFIINEILLSIKLNYYVAHFRHLARAGVVDERKPKQVERKSSQLFNSLSRPLDKFLSFSSTVILPFWHLYRWTAVIYCLSVCVFIVWKEELERRIYWRGISDVPLVLITYTDTHKNKRLWSCWHLVEIRILYPTRILINRHFWRFILFILHYEVGAMAATAT